MNVIIEGTEYLPIAAAAKQLATTEMRILMLLKRRALEGELIEGDWYVTTASLACFDPADPALRSEPACRSTCTSSTCGCTTTVNLER